MITLKRDNGYVRITIKEGDGHGNISEASDELLSEAAEALALAIQAVAKGAVGATI